MYLSWSDVLQNSLQNIWLGVANFIPTLVVALIIFIVGLIVGAIFYKFVYQLVKLARIDTALKAAGVEKFVERAGFKLDSGMFLGKLVQWFFVIVFLVAALDVLGLKQVTAFLSDVVLGYLPQVIVAAFILLIAAVVAEAMQKVVVGMAQSAGLKSVNFAGKVTKWAIWIFAVLAAVLQLGIATSFVNTIFTGIIIAVSLAVGLAFGLGGQESAARYLDKVRSEISNTK
jgi:small-conductance mechanosensitive channel